MNGNDIVNTYTGLRKSSTVAVAARATIERLSITPSSLVDAFNAAYLDGSRGAAEAEAIRNHRNELLSHFDSKSQHAGRTSSRKVFAARAPKPSTAREETR